MIGRKIRHRQPMILMSYIASIVALIIVPILLLDVIFLTNGLHQTESSYAASQEYALRQAIRNMDEDMESYRLVANHIAADSDVTPYILKENSYDTVLAIKKLAVYHAQVSFFDELYLYINGDSKVYSGKGVTDVETFFRSVWRFEDGESEEAFRRFVEAGRTFALSINGNGGYPVKLYNSKEYIAITCSWLDSGIRSLGTMIGMVEADYFTDKLDISDPGYHECVYLFDAAGRLQFGLENGLKLSDEAKLRLLENYADPGIHTGKVNGISCFVITEMAETTHWKYVVVIPRPQFFLKYVRSENKIVTGISLLLILCIVLGIVLAFRMYRPIRKLWMILEHVAPPKQDILKGIGPEMVRRGEWEHLQNSVSRIAEMNKSVNRELEENKEMYCQSLLKALLFGAVNVEHVRETLAVQNIVFTEEYYTVIVLYCMSATRKKPAETLKALIEAKKLRSLYVLLTDNSGCLTLLWNTAVRDEDLEGELVELYESVTEETEMGWLFAVGSICQDLNGVGRSYAEALAVGDSMQEKGRTGIFHYGEFRKVQESNELYQDILAYVDAHYDDSDISLSGVAEKFGLSTSYLSRFFRKCSGMNFLEYVMDRRIKKACCLLRDTDLKIKDIVEQVGYFDVASFTKKFRNVIGVSPAKYREQIRQEGEEQK